LNIPLPAHKAGVMGCCAWATEAAKHDERGNGKAGAPLAVAVNFVNADQTEPPKDAIGGGSA
jgi:hypothetical protein